MSTSSLTATVLYSMGTRRILISLQQSYDIFANLPFVVLITLDVVEFYDVLLMGSSVQYTV